MISNTFRALPLLLCCAIAAGCSKEESTDSSPPADTVDPTVTAVSPAEDALSISSGATFAVTFSEAMNAATITPSSFYMLDPGGDPVEGAISYNPATLTATFTPAYQLTVGATYQLVVTPATRDPAGNALNMAFTATFIPTVDDVAPRLARVTPVTEAAPNTTITVYFDEPLVTSSAAGVQIEAVDANGDLITGALNYNAAGGWVTLTPDAPLALATAYTVYLTADAADAAGNWNHITYTWTFTSRMPTITGTPVVSATASQGRPLMVTVPVGEATQQVIVYLGTDMAGAGTAFNCGTYSRPTPEATEITATCNVPVAQALGQTAIWVEARNTTTYRSYYRWHTAYSTTHYALSTDLGVTWTASIVLLAMTDVVVDTTPVGPDLSVTLNSVTGGPPDATYTVSYTVTNNGDVASGPFALGVYGSASTTPAVFWAPDVWVDIADLAAGASTTATVTLPVPAFGYPIVNLFVDVDDMVAEANEANNAGVAIDKRPAPVATSTNSTPAAIPDVSTINVAIVVSSAPTEIQDLTVSLTLTHTFMGDLRITLVSPAGTEVILSNRRGGGGDNMTGAVFDNRAATPISAGVAPFAGTFRPDGFFGTFANENANGSWTLRIQDLAGADIGTFSSVTLRFW